MKIQEWTAVEGYGGEGKVTKLGGGESSDGGEERKGGEAMRGMII